MKPNKLTPGHNLRWESSRMMLPEHVEALNRHRLDSLKKEMPELDDQQLMEFERMVKDYIQCEVMVYVTVYGEYKDKDYYGKITKVDPHLKRIKLEWQQGEELEYEWIYFKDVFDIYT